MEVKNEPEFDVIFLDAKNDRQKIFIEPDCNQELFNRPKELSHKCKSCEKTFNRVKSLQSHSLQCHNFNLEQVTVRIEPTSYEDESSHDRRNQPLEIPLNQLPVEKQFKCKSCHKAFKTPGELKVHFRVHTGEKPYECITCRMRFTQSGNLNSHIRRLHIGETPYKCLTCDKNFADMSNFKRHCRLHITYDLKDSKR